MEDWIVDNDILRHDDPQIPLIEGDEGDAEFIKSLANELSYVGKKLTTDKRVPGWINDPAFFSFWEKELKASPFVLETLRNGYRFPFKEIPSTFAPI